MKILITGAKGFVGKNVSTALKMRKHEVFEFDEGTSREVLFEYINRSSFIIHLAGVNRTLSKEEFYQGNSNFTYDLIQLIKRSKCNVPLIFASSIQANLENDYGRSKKMAEDFLLSFQKESGIKTYIYRLSNIFGKWSKPNYNSVVATFCHNVSRDLPIQISDPAFEIPLVYIDDVVNEFVSIVEGNKLLDSTEIQTVGPIYRVTVGRLAELIRNFKEIRLNLELPNTGDSFIRKLYATYLSYLEPDNFSYLLRMNKDMRGSFTEFIKTSNSGQISVNVTKPGITKGNHFHNTKNEKFLVVSGVAQIKLRKVGSEDLKTFEVNCQQMTVVDIPPGYTHNITNIGQEDLVTIMWASEPFDKDKPDTFFLEV